MLKTSVSNKNQRPISPHVSIYRRDLGTLISIGHRMAGFGMFLLLLIFCWWFIFWVASDFDPDYLDYFETRYIVNILVVCSAAYFHHFCNGIRHFIWDAGYSLDYMDNILSAMITMFATICLTFFYWVFMSQI